MRIFGCVFFVMILVSYGCSQGNVRNGLDDSGAVSYQLCERSRQRITDTRRATFDLPDIFKNTPCNRERSSYGYHASLDTFYVRLLGVIANKDLMDVGGIYGMSFYGGTKGRQSFYLKPDVFFADHQEEVELDRSGFKLVTASWVERESLRCARFYTEREGKLKLTRKLEYYCWESVSGFDSPFLVAGSQSIPAGSHAVTNLDKELIEPVLASLQVNRASPAQLAQFATERSAYCATLKSNYDAEKWAGYALSDFPDRRRAIRALRGCGYAMPDPVGITTYEELFISGDHLIGEGDRFVRHVSPEQFAELEQKLLSLHPRKLPDRPKTNTQVIDPKTGRLVTKYYFAGGYTGDWYVIPPDYSEREGFGIRNDPVEGRVIDIHMPGYEAGFRVVGD